MHTLNKNVKLQIGCFIFFLLPHSCFIQVTKGVYFLCVCLFLGNQTHGFCTANNALQDEIQNSHNIIHFTVLSFMLLSHLMFNLFIIF